MHKTIEEQYVWRLPVRFYHWLNAICVTLLFITGLYIASPVLSPSIGEAVWYHKMAWFRYVHFGTAFIFAANFMFRLYWSLFGNDPYGRFGGFRPWRPEWWGQPFKDQLASYLFIRKEEPNYCGHNPVAALTHFLFVFCGSLFMVLTGFAMYGENNPGGFLDTTFGWMVLVFGSSQSMHTMHHLVAWVFPVYLVLHLYAVIRHDIVDRSSVTSSIITGYKHRVEECPELE
ncbi:MAG: Ni/Fe-hydrogenase, b-type cytochrome subunit [Candidatus Marinimicrobia bacterium]|jgi:Ni/Fe-hydrogenase 1 B-type cytochrome subunit|nr:Ni/Fe-hydrogenase, b-type cytochrome subunit [Candidatus Neomarinimicrobiota bacterium]MDP6456572.1 Ni/Fe-hydrogenase, b-type cytochrome subunit [Candidatus Neomarinimicrobiota bacterium]MDP6593118.1 Ni/Fe-hydrogenase, b-type cytochrome subunit [Candidatus Neomarinimicrobiota bacterium]MDP6836789.1 Ni/Fe-hydrogenase, b-type cytochrome subunit [Candidatus Neomarinimicrobiota bacterium]MDP6965679.1 Ni/Fe-hydrogenase, b-type cytochrome subunit [Candidatus Neomarinimicrobiota bacterium]